MIYLHSWDSNRNFRTLFLSFFLFCIQAQFAAGQSYLGTVIKSANLRAGAGGDYEVLSTLKKGETVFVFPSEPELDFYNVIRVKTGTEGWVSKKLVKLGKEVEKSKGSAFSPLGEIESSNSEAEVFNNTSLTLSLRLNGTTHTFSPGEKRKLELTEGKYDYYAFAAGVLPASGEHFFESGMGYTWQFYISTVRTRSRGVGLGRTRRRR